MVCLHCGKKLSVVKKLTTGEFCSAAHKKAYLLEQERFALARLLENQKKFGAADVDGAPALGAKRGNSTPAAESKGNTAGFSAGSREPLRKQPADSRQASSESRRAAKSATAKDRAAKDIPIEAGYLLGEVKAKRAAPLLAIPPSSAKLELTPQLPEAAVELIPTALEVDPSSTALHPRQASPSSIAVEEKHGYEAFFSLLSRTTFEDEPLARLTSPLARGEVSSAAPRESHLCPMDFQALPHLVNQSGAQRSLRQFIGHNPLDLSVSLQLSPLGLPDPGSMAMYAEHSPYAAQLQLPPARPIRFPAQVEASADLVTGDWLTANCRQISPAAALPGDGAHLEAFGCLPVTEVEVAIPSLHSHCPSLRGHCLPKNFRQTVEPGLLPCSDSLRCPVLGVHSLHARPPRKAYSFAPRPQQFPLSVPAANGSSCLTTPKPRLEIRLVALDFDCTNSQAPTRKLRANGETSFGKLQLLLPVHKAKIKPVQEHQSVFSALGHLTGGSAEFSWRGMEKRWARVPNDLRWIAMAIPIVIGLIWYSSLPSRDEQPHNQDRANSQVLAEVGSSSARDSTRGRIRESSVRESSVRESKSESTRESGIISRLASDSSMDELKRSIQQRAAVELVDDFRQGLAEWSGVGDWASGWRYDRAGFIRPRNLALFTPSLDLRNYRFEFLGQIESKALSWVFRAADVKNYYVNRLEIVEPGPLPKVVLARYAVINGKAGPRTVVRLPMQVQMDTLYRVRVEVSGDDFVTTVQGQIVDVFSDSRVREGGVGFFAHPGEEVRLRWVEVSHQYDFLGKLCAFLVPYDVSSGSGRSPGQ